MINIGSVLKREGCFSTIKASSSVTSQTYPSGIWKLFIIFWWDSIRISGKAKDISRLLWQDTTRTSLSCPYKDYSLLQSTSFHKWMLCFQIKLSLFEIKWSLCSINQLETVCLTKQQYFCNFYFFFTHDLLSPAVDLVTQSQN